MAALIDWLARGFAATRPGVVGRAAGVGCASVFGADGPRIMLAALLAADCGVAPCCLATSWSSGGRCQCSACSTGRRSIARGAGDADLLAFDGLGMVAARESPCAPRLARCAVAAGDLLPVRQLPARVGGAGALDCVATR